MGGETCASCAGSQGTHRPRRRCRSRAACAATVNSQPRRFVASPPGLQVPQELEKRLLHDILGVLVVAGQTTAKRLDRRAVLLEQPLCRL
jgi:hypothetical protein